jgi:hypothetical protein
MVAIAGVGACSLLVDHGDLVGPNGGNDLDGNAPVIDGPQAADVSSAGEAAVSDGALASCAATFCENFDAPGFDARWNEPGYDIKGGTIELSEVDAISKPKSLVSRVPPGGQACGGASVAKIFIGSSNAVKTTFDLWRDGDDGTYVMLALGDQSGRCDTFINSDQGRWSVYFYDQNGAERYERANLALPLIKTWTRVEIEADFAAKQARIAHGGNSTTVPLGTCGITRGDGLVQLGFSCEATSSQPREVRFDDLSVELR